MHAQELVETHARIDADLAAEVGLVVADLDGLGRLIGDEAREASVRRGGRVSALALGAGVRAWLT